MATIIITGAGTGIGQALAIHFANLGHTILAIGRRIEPLQETQNANPKNIFILSADVSDNNDREKIATIVATLPKPIYLIHNAAILEPLTPLAKVTLGEWRQIQMINVEAPLFLTKALLPYLNEGRVLHISSGLAHQPLLGSGAYCTSKAALYMLYQCLREELLSANIAVGSFIPGIVDTPMQAFIRTSKPNNFPSVERFIEFNTQKSLVSPTIIAEAIAWLLLQTDNQQFTKQEWHIDNIRAVLHI